MNEEEIKQPPLETTPPEIQNPVLQPELEVPTEKPVMIVENIDENTAEATPNIPVTSPAINNAVQIPNNTSEVQTESNSEVIIPTDGPNLGNPNDDKNSKQVPTFQQIPIPVETPSEESITISTPTDQDKYQAQTKNQEPFVEQTPEQETPNSSEDTIVTDDYDEETTIEEVKQKRKIFPIILISIIIILIIAVIIMFLKPKESESKIEMLRPERSANSNMNIAVLGDTTTPSAELVRAITKKFGTEVSIEDIESCTENENNGFKYRNNSFEIKTISDKFYNIIYPCDYNSAIRYLFVSEGNDTIDGAILIVSSQNGITEQVTNYINALKGLSMNRIVIYLTPDGDTAKAEIEIKEFLEKKELDSKNTPIVIGKIQEETVEEVITKTENWIAKDESYKKPSVVSGYKQMSLYTIFLTTEEGFQEPQNDISSLTFTINGKDYSGTISLEEGYDSINPGDTQTLKVKIKGNIPMIPKMRVEVKQNNTLIGLGVISEVK